MERCYECDGYGIVMDYGLFGLDFFGPKTCKHCLGTGKVKSRDRLGRFIKEKLK